MSLLVYYLSVCFSTLPAFSCYNKDMRNALLALFFLFIFGVPARAQNDHVRIAEQNAPAIVAVNVIKADGSTFTGTGFVLTPDGLVATTRHVTKDALYINLTFNTGAVSGEAVPVAQAGNVDLALLQIHAKNLPHVTVVPSDTVLPGQTITVIGNPRRLQNTISSGLISQIRKKADGVLWHQISAPISPSSSGSPVFDHNGNVISVVFGSYKGEGNQNLNFSVPSNYLIQLVKAAGLQLPPSTEEEDAQTAKPTQTDNPVWAHLKKSWSILMRLLHAK